MSEVAVTGEALPPPSAPGRIVTLRNKLLQLTKQSVATAAWLYVLTKLFVFDFDSYFVQTYAPPLQWVLDYKFFLLLGALGIAAAFVSKWKLLGFVAYVLFYPLFLALLVIPYALLKLRSWVVGIAVANTVIRFFADFRTNAVMWGLFALSALGISIGRNSYVLVAAIAGMAAFVLASYVLAVIGILKPDPAFRLYTKMIGGLRKFTMKSCGLGEELAIVPIENFTPDQLEKRKTNLQSAIVANRLFLFTASKLEVYRQSRLKVLTSVFQCIWLVVACIAAFALINYGIYKLDPAQFMPSTPPSAFLLGYYSFKTFILNSVSELVPTGRIAQIASMAENGIGLFTVPIFAGTLLSQRNERHAKEIERAVKSIEQEAVELEGFVRREFRITTIDEAIAEMERAKAGLLGFILWLSPSAGPQ